MKKKILMVLALVSVALLSIGGTVAYYTDEETSTTVYTTGNVSVELRQDTTNTELMPGEYIYPNYRIANTGDNDAYVWVEVAIPTTLDVSGSSANNVLHWNQRGAYVIGYNHEEERWKAAGLTEALPDDETWSDETQSIPEVRTIDGVEYYVYTIKYNGVLSSGEETVPAVYRMFLDARVDYNDEGEYWTFVENGVETKIDHDFAKNSSFIVTAHAIQTAGFESFAAAYEAYQNQWTTTTAE